MNGNQEVLQNKISNFNASYGVDFSFEKLEAEALKYRYLLRSFAVSSDKNYPENRAYREYFVNLFKESVNGLISKKINVLDHEDMFRAYEDIMSDYRTQCVMNDKTASVENGGWKKSSEIVEALQKSINHVNTNKYEYMKEEIIARRVRLRDMRAFMAEQNKNTEFSAEDLSNAIVYKNALERVSQSHPTWWKRIHWIRNRAEQRELKSLQSFINAKTQNDPALLENAQKMAEESPVAQLKDDLNTALEKNGLNQKEKTDNVVKEPIAVNDTEVIRESQKTQKPKAKREPSKTVADRLMKEKSFKNNMLGDIKKLIGDNVKRMELDDTAEAIYDTVIENAKNLNDTYDELIANNANEQQINEAMHEQMEFIYFGAFSSLASCNMSPQQHVIVAQKLTNTVLNKVTAVGFNKEELGKYGDSYAVKDCGIVREALGTLEKFQDYEAIKTESNNVAEVEFSKIILGAKKELGIVDKRQVNVDFGNEKSTKEVSSMRFEAVKNDPFLKKNI